MFKLCIPWCHEIATPQISESTFHIPSFQVPRNRLICLFWPRSGSFPSFLVSASVPFYPSIKLTYMAYIPHTSLTCLLLFPQVHKLNFPSLLSSHHVICFSCASFMFWPPRDVALSWLWCLEFHTQSKWSNIQVFLQILDFSSLVGQYWDSQVLYSDN